jgi:DNA-directed RNA polymerase specialized sigma24 family protein
LSDSARQSRIEWVLTEEAFAKFLHCLDPDPARAGEKYQELHEMLVKFLDWRGAPFPEDLVDEAFNRVTRKLDEGETIRDLPAYCHSVARLVFLQSLEHPGSKRVELENLPPIAIPEPEVTDVRRECLNHCLRQLTAENRELITEYYRKEKREKIDHRTSMAEKLGIPLNALRSRAQRIRNKLERCIMRCCKDRNFRPT